MCYSAELLRGEDIVLPAEQTWAMIAANRDSWSWTHSYDHYVKAFDHVGTRLAVFFDDYGFETQLKVVDDDQFVVLSDWQGSTGGFSHSLWDECWPIIAQAAVDDYEWIMEGEDRGDIWAETRCDGRRVERGVQLVVNYQS